MSSRFGVFATSLAVLTLGLPAGPAIGQINVFLDYASFQNRLDEATTSAGVANFNASEVTTIRGNVLGALTSIYSGYEISFTESNPGGVFERLWFGGIGGSLGVATRLDFRNQHPDDLGRIFTANFDFTLETGDPRAVQISEFSTALAGTAAHELGHNLGLEHRDPFGIADAGIADFSGGLFTGGLQNNHIMATGSTGLSEAGREVQRSVSDLGHVKLEFAQGVVATPLSTTLEQPGAHDSAATAQSIFLQDLSVGLSGYGHAAVVEGSNAADEQDFYSLQLDSPSFVTVQMHSQLLFSDDLDSILEIYDTDGSTLLLLNDDTTYNINGVNMGGTNYSSDATAYNFFADSAGTYYFNIRQASAGDNGLYELLFAVSSIPEPAAGLPLAVALFACAWVWRRRVRAARCV